MARGDLHRPLVAALVAVATLVVLLPGASAQSPSWRSFLTKAVFDKFFPKRIAFYSYKAFTNAGRAPYSAFGTSGSQDDRKRELAAFLANVKHESGGLVYTVEQNPQSIYCQPSAKWPCAPKKKYIGRGPIQLTWNYNYGACGKALGKNLLADPDQVAQNSATAFQTALWFWMSKGPHAAIMRNSFSGTIKAINGGLECGKPAGSQGNKQMLSRVANYKSFCRALGVKPGTDLTC